MATSAHQHRLPRTIRVERLEARWLLSAIRIVSWNTANGPDNASEDAAFRTVLNAIGQETVQGRTLPPALVALQETDTAVFGGNSIARIDAVLESLYPGTRYERAAAPLDSGDDATGFVYNAAFIDLVATAVVEETAGMTRFAHEILRGQFRPLGTAGPSDFYVYSTHLKAGSSSSNAGRRAAEAAAIRADLDRLGPGQDALVVGDFNIGGSAERAYQNFLAPGAGQLRDPLDRPGAWKNNPAFLDIHTQNPAVNGPGGMDDRYDFQLATGAVFDDEGLQYVSGSYRAFGNNGTHQFNSDITTGSGAATGVLAALAAASDHLPVVADYDIDAELPGVSLLATDGFTRVSESGLTDSYSVVLDATPDRDVTVTITTDSQTLVNGAATATLTFTPTDARCTQTVVITAVDDDAAEGDHSSQLRHDISSTDATFNVLPSINLRADVIDNDLAQVVISELMYNPSGAEPESEWIEVVNLGPGPVDWSDWRFDDEDSLDWGVLPPSTDRLNPGQIAIVHPDTLSSAAFRAAWNVPDAAQVVGVSWGSLANSPSASSERLQLLDATGTVRDEVNYDDDGSRWPADQNGPSIYLSDVRADNNTGSNWERSSAGVDAAVRPTGDSFGNGDVGSPGRIAGWDPAPPQVASLRWDDNQSDHPQRSLLRRVHVTFDRLVTLDDQAFNVTKRDTTQEEPEVSLQVALTDAGVQSTATLTFSGHHTDPRSGSLRDGNYRLTLFADRISTRSSGIALDGDRDGLPGGDLVIGQHPGDRFFRLLGDRDGDRDVDGQDLAALAQSYLSSAGDASFDPAFDSDADGEVDGSDLAAIRRREFRRLPWPSA